MNTDELIRQLHEARQEESGVGAEVDILRAELESLRTWQRYEEAKAVLKITRNIVKELEAEVKDALLEPALAGDRHPAVHAVRTSINFDYDEEIALAWAKEHLPDAIKLDRRRFEKYCKEASESEFLPMPAQTADSPTFVEVGESHSLSIKRDLSEFVVEEEREDA